MNGKNEELIKNYEKENENKGNENIESQKVKNKNKKDEINRKIVKKTINENSKDYDLMKNTVKININGKEIYLVGTAHVLKESVDEVQYVIENVKPDKVCVELCESRYKSLKDKEKWKKLDIVKVIKEGKGFLLFANMVLSSFQKRIGVDMKSAPGEEMMKAISVAEKNNIDIVLADRDINVTLKRAWSLSSFKDKLRILEILMESIFTKEKVDKEDIEELMEGKDIFNEIMEIFAEKLPMVKKSFIDERNLYLANKILNADGQKIVAVIGKGHLQGIKQLIENGFNYDSSIEFVPPKKKYSKYLAWVITAIVLLIFGYGFYKGGTKVAFSMFKAWVLANGIFTSIFALLVLAHPLTILAAWAVSPITSLNPTIGAGFVLALIEAFFRKPRVMDFESLSEDILTFKGFFKNRITKILLVFISTSIGSTIGTFVGLPWITALLK